VQVFPSASPKKLPEKTYCLLPTPEKTSSSACISWPGEYDYGGLAIRGLGKGDQVSYIVTSEGLRCGFLSSPIGKWEEQEIETLGDLDVLVLPSDDPKAVQHIVEEVDPPVVIPLRGKDAKAYQEVLKICGAKDSEPVKEVKLKKSGLPTDTRVVYVLEE
jgi:hypothetical protein